MSFEPEDEGGPRKGPEAFRTISEVADDLGLPQHVLRFWESRFPQIKPVKRGGGRRYYRPNDVELLRGVKQLLYGEGYTIRGVQRILREQGGRKLAQAAGREIATPHAPPVPEVEVHGPDQGAGFDLGPAVWASGKRPAPEPSFDPPPASRAYDAPGDESIFEPAAPSVAEPQRSPSQAGRLTADQTVRLTAALDELLACRALLEARSA